MSDRRGRPRFGRRRSIENCRATGELSHRAAPLSTSSRSARRGDEIIAPPELQPEGPPSLATDKELSDFLKSVEKRAFKRTVYTVRDDEAALDIVQDAMIRLAEKYADRPAAE